MITQIVVRSPHLTPDEVKAEVRSRIGVREVSDACAASIAEMFREPGLLGFTKLAAGKPVTQEEISHDIAAHWPKTWDALNQDCLSMLGTWALHWGEIDGR